MKKQAKGPKFRVGQVAGIIDGDGAWLPFFSELVSIEWDEKRKEYRYGLQPDRYGHIKMFRIVESCLRPLTAREAGPARGRGK